jgi:hypothetical protein
MPRYAIKVGHYLILETIVTIDAPDRIQARQLAENMKDRGTFGMIAWEVKDAYLQEPWTVASQNIEIETVQEVQP